MHMKVLYPVGVVSCYRYLFLSSAAKSDQDDNADTVRAKYFIRDKFVVSEAIP